MLTITLTVIQGLMEDISKYLGSRSTLLLLYLMVWVSSLTEGFGRISHAVGSRVTLHCNFSREGLQQLTWKKHAITLHSIRPGFSTHTDPEANRLNIGMPAPPDYALVIDRLQAMHRGNYSCETTTSERTLEEKWELDIKEETWKHENTLIVAVIVPCVCGVIFIISLIVLLCRRHSRSCCGCCCAAQQEQVEEDIYENCLDVDIQHRSHNRRNFRPLNK